MWGFNRYLLEEKREKMLVEIYKEINNSLTLRKKLNIFQSMMEKNVSVRLSIFNQLIYSKRIILWIPKYC